MADLQKSDYFSRINKKLQDRKNGVKEPVAPVEPVAKPAVAPVAAAPAAVAAPVVAPVAAPVAPVPATSTGSGDTMSPTNTKTQTGGSSPGGAATGGVGSGIGGAGTGGAATGGASTGGAGTVTVTISGSSSTETSSGAGSKKSGKGGKAQPQAPITLNISNVGGKTDAGNVASGDGPGAKGSAGGKATGSPGGGGASPDEPENYSTSRKDKPVKSNMVDKDEEAWKKNVMDQIRGKKALI